MGTKRWSIPSSHSGGGAQDIENPHQQQCKHCASGDIVDCILYDVYATHYIQHCSMYISRHCRLYLCCIMLALYVLGDFADCMLYNVNIVRTRRHCRLHVVRCLDYTKLTILCISRHCQNSVLCLHYPL